MTLRVGPYYSAKSCSGSAEVTSQRMQAYLTARFDAMTNGGIYNCRNIAGSSQLSVHGTGRAGDTMTGAGHPTAASLYLAEQMRVFSAEIGIQGIIHNRRQWFCHNSTGWRSYSGQNPHVDHIHWERTVNMELTAARIVQLFQGPSPTGNALLAGAEVKLGSTGEPVKHVQRRIGAHGFNITVDGECGPKTVAAIRQFQAFAGIQVDGEAGKVTQGRLQ